HVEVVFGLVNRGVAGCRHIVGAFRTLEHALRTIRRRRRHRDRLCRAFNDARAAGQGYAERGDRRDNIQFHDFPPYPDVPAYVRPTKNAPASWRLFLMWPESQFGLMASSVTRYGKLNGSRRPNTLGERNAWSDVPSLLLATPALALRR